MEAAALLLLHGAVKYMNTHVGGVLWHRRHSGSRKEYLLISTLFFFLFLFLFSSELNDEVRFEIGTQSHDRGG
jgi:hypothetical protein